MFTTKEEFLAGVTNGLVREMVVVEWFWHDGEKLVNGTHTDSGKRKYPAGIDEIGVRLTGKRRGQESYLSLEEGDVWEFAGRKLTITTANKKNRIIYIVNPIM